MKPFKPSIILSVLALFTSISCKKAAVPTVQNPNTQLEAYINNSLIQFNGKASEPSPNQYVISGVSGNNVKIQISFAAPAVGTYTLGTMNFNGEATLTSGSGEVWSTNIPDSGSVYVSTLTSSPNSISGSFSFSAIETKPTPNASTESVTSGSFNLTW